MLHLHVQWCAAVQSTEDVWNLFKAKFLELWDGHKDGGDLYPGCLFGPDAPLGPKAKKVRL